jgi:hypothetical protein
LPNTHSQQDKNQLARVLAVVSATQNQFGKTPAEFEMQVEGLSKILSHRPMGQIIGAIEKFVLTNSHIPTPADIEKIIEPPLPKIDWPLYIELKKQLREGNVYVDRDEKQFCRNCEDLAILKQRGELENFNDAQRQLDVYTRNVLSYDSE